MAVDFNFITPRLATGGALGDAADIETLVAAGLTHVIDATTDADQNFDDVGSFANHPAIMVLWNPTQDDGTTKDPSWFAQSIEFGLNSLARPSTKLYCHCTSGIDRGPSTAFAVMLALGFTYDVAITMIRTARPVTVGGIKYAADAANAIRVLGYS